MIARPVYKPADNAQLRHADYRNYTHMLIGSAKLRDGILVARGLPPLGLPAVNENARRGPLSLATAKPKQRLCTDCGTPLACNKNKTGLCRSCLDLSKRLNRDACKECGAALANKNTSGFCRNHNGRKSYDATPDAATTVLLRKVAAQFKITVADIVGLVRERAFVEARAVVVMALRQMGYSFPRIGQVLGRNHTSCLYLVTSFPLFVKRNPALAARLAAVM